MEIKTIHLEKPYYIIPEIKIGIQDLLGPGFILNTEECIYEIKWFPKIIKQGEDKLLLSFSKNSYSPNLIEFDILTWNSIKELSLVEDKIDITQETLIKELLRQLDNTFVLESKIILKKILQIEFLKFLDTKSFKKYFGELGLKNLKQLLLKTLLEKRYITDYLITYIPF